MEQIMELTEYVRKGNVMNIKENYYIYKFKELGEQTEEQKNTKENDNQNSIVTCQSIVGLCNRGCATERC
jgi:hypothetical protein